jgi:hypothetical protein
VIIEVGTVAFDPQIPECEINGHYLKFAEACATLAPGSASPRQPDKAPITGDKHVSASTVTARLWRRP